MSEHGSVDWLHKLIPGKYLVFPHVFSLKVGYRDILHKTVPHF